MKIGIVRELDGLKNYGGETEYPDLERISERLKQKKPLSAADSRHVIQILDGLAFHIDMFRDILNSHAKGTSLSAPQAAAYSTVLDRLGRPPNKPYSDAMKLTFFVAYSYVIRQLLEPAVSWKIHRHIVANIFSVSETTVGTYSSKWAREIKVVLAVVIDAKRAHGKTVRQILEEERSRFEGVQRKPTKNC